jgi:hypothetical protein
MLCQKLKNQVMPKNQKSGYAKKTDFELSQKINRIVMPKTEIHFGITFINSFWHNLLKIFLA